MKVTVIRARLRQGFALPTILIASVIMLTVLVSAVSATSSLRAGLDSQYYNQLAKEAAESGLARARECLASNGYVPQWNANNLYPSTSCSGGSPCTNSSSCFVMQRSSVRSTFSVDPPINQTVSQLVKVHGTVELLRSSNGGVWKTYDYSMSARVGIDLSLSSVVFGYVGGVGAFFATLAADSSLSAVGLNNYGQLGNGTMTDSLTPLKYQLPGGEKPARVYSSFLSLGWDMFVVTATGKLYGAGNNSNLQLGNSGVIATNVSTPVQFLIPNGELARSVGVAGYANFVTTTSNNVYAVGECLNGLLGYNYTISGCTPPGAPVRVALPAPLGSDLNTLPTDNLAVDNHSAFLRMQGGRVYGWGQGGYGSLANGTFNDSSFPVQVGTYGNAGQPKAIQVTTDGVSVWILDDSGNVFGAGYNGFGDLGMGSTATAYYNTLVQFALPDPNIKITKIAADQYSLLALTNTGDVYGAGSNTNGQLGIGGAASQASPTPTKYILPAGVKAVDLYNTSVGNSSGSTYNNTYVIGDDGNVYGTGSNTYGQMGNGTSGSDVLVPVKMSLPVGVTAKQVQAGYGTAVILTSDNKIYTVGNNSNGQLGDGTTNNSSTPRANRYTNVLPVTNF
jgi:alpha-tubulin suppressor-like RCC1 family protein